MKELNKVETEWVGLTPDPFIHFGFVYIITCSKTRMK